MRGRRIQSLIVIVGALSASVAGLWWYALRPETPFLPRHAPAEWIIYPRPAWYFGQRVAELDATFEKTFVLDELPASATLSVAAFRRVEVELNGQLLFTTGTKDSPWKRVDTVDATAALRQGDNELRVTVINHDGPSALWLALFANDQAIVVSDSSWQVTRAGSTVQPARLASADRATARLQGFPPSPWDAVRARWPTLFGFAAAALALWIALEWWQSKADDSAGLSPRAATALLAVVAVMWVGMVFNNQGWLSPGMGFDARAHRRYIEYLRVEKSLPPADYNIETHQPPLYYLLGALVTGSLGVSALEPAGSIVLRLLGVGLGIVCVGLVFLNIRLLFPRHAGRQVAGLVLAGFLPVHLFIFQYTTNETLTAVLCAAALYVALRILQSEQPSWWPYALLGVLLGAALSSKLTALVVVAATLGVLGAASLVRREGDWRRRGLPALGLTMVLVVVCGGFHYARTWRDFGTAIYRHVDQPEGRLVWIDPGMHTVEHFWRFGGVLRQPYFAGQHALPDALYSTLWGAGRMGGRGDLRIVPPWNYDLVSAGYLLALMPSALIVCGLVLAVARLVIEPSAEWFLILAIALLMIVALLFENLQHPRITVAKAWYGLPAITSLCALGAWAAGPGGRRWWWIRGPIFVLLGTWAMTSYASFWVRGNTADVHARLGAALADEKRYQEAARHLEAVLRADPNHSDANFWYGYVLNAHGRLNPAMRSFQRAVTQNPNDIRAGVTLARGLAMAGQFEEAIQLVTDAARRAPDDLRVYYAAVEIYGFSGRHAEALAAVREGLRLQPDAVKLHAHAVRLYEALGNFEAAERHRQYAQGIDPDHEDLPL